MSGGMIMPGDLDAALCNMIRDAVVTISAWIDGEGGGHQGSFDLSDVNWDHPAAVPEGVIYADDGRVKRAHEASHAIGFICGVAAALDVTPMTLVESYEERETTRQALCQMAGVSDPSLREHAERAYRMLDKFPLTTRKLVEAQGFVPPATPPDGANRRAAVCVCGGGGCFRCFGEPTQRAKRPTATRRQKIKIPPKKK